MSHKQALEQPAPWKLLAPLYYLPSGTGEMAPENSPAGVLWGEKWAGSPRPWEVAASGKEKTVAVVF